MTLSGSRFAAGRRRCRILMDFQRRPGAGRPFEKGCGRAILPATGPDMHCNLKVRLCCKFAADIATINRRHNFMLRSGELGAPARFCGDWGAPTRYCTATRKYLISAQELGR